jgi:hypothetical protein
MVVSENPTNGGKFSAATNGQTAPLMNVSNVDFPVIVAELVQLCERAKAACEDARRLR